MILNLVLKDNHDNRVGFFNQVTHVQRPHYILLNSKNSFYVNTHNITNKDSSSVSCFTISSYTIVLLSFLHLTSSRGNRRFAERSASFEECGRVFKVL